jgi:hypothetical protein
MRKTSLIVIALVTLLIVSCNRNEIAKFNQQKDSLMLVIDKQEKAVNEKEAAMNEFLSSFNEIERNLDSISTRQKIIYMDADKSRGEFRASQKDRINLQIKAINESMDANRKTLAGLNRKLNNSSRMNEQLKESIALLTEQLKRKDEELAELNDRLIDLNIRVVKLQTAVDSLETQNLAKTKTIEDNLNTLHTAYYLVGGSKALREAKITDKKGGLLGIGKTTKLNTNFDKDKFTRIDYTKTDKIPLNSENVKIVTNHPEGSYKLEIDPSDKDLVKNLIVTDPEKFWSVSRFLVIEGKLVKPDKTISVKEKANQGN